MRPSVVTATSLASTGPPAGLASAIPLVPKLASRVPVEVYRSNVKLLEEPAQALTRIWPVLGRMTTPLAWIRGLPPSGVDAIPELPNEASRVPSALSLATPTTADPDTSREPTTTILPSDCSAI